MPPPIRSEDLERQARLAAELMLRAHGWELLAPGELAKRASELLWMGRADRLESAMIGAYCVALHVACSGAEGPARQNRGYSELARYLYSLVGMRYPDLPPDVREDVAQSAIERVFRAFERCREPVAFLAFAAQHLRNAVRIIRRQVYRPVDSLERFVGAEEPDAGDLLPDPQPPTIEQIIAAERRALIERLLHEFAAAHPRAAQQVAILRMLELDELDGAEVAQRLGTTTGSVYTAHSRICKRLQSEPRWRARAAALGLIEEV